MFVSLCGPLSTVLDPRSLTALDASGTSGRVEGRYRQRDLTLDIESINLAGHPRTKYGSDDLMSLSACTAKAADT